MVYKYKNANIEYFVDFDKVEKMELKTFLSIDQDESVSLTIFFDTGKTTTIVACVKYKIIEDKTVKSEYPLEKVRKIANSWMKWKNETKIKKEITKENNKEIIVESLIK
jgi:hypothetical protein